MLKNRGTLWFACLTSVFLLAGASRFLTGSPLHPQPERYSLDGTIAAGEARAGGSFGSRTTDISGKWHFVLDTEDGNRDVEAQFKVTGDQVTGTWQKADVKGTFHGSDLDLAFPLTSEEAGMTATLKLKGTLTDGKLKGTWAFADYSGDFTATPEQ
jgi:hypothetical protein